MPGNSPHKHLQKFLGSFQNGCPPGAPRGLLQHWALAALAFRESPWLAGSAALVWGHPKAGAPSPAWLPGQASCGSQGCGEHQWLL